MVVIHGNLSLTSEGDRRFALSLSRHAVRWFREGGLTADLCNDDQMAGGLRDRKVAMLIHCANVTPEQLWALKQFVKRGGRLIVCYSSSPGLADLMGVALGAYVKVEPGRLASMHFEPLKPVNTPLMIQQSSPNIFPATAIPGRSTVLAWWVDRAGQRTDQAAWLQSDAGFWMTHTLSADGGSAAKGRLLVALAGDKHRELWMDAARVRFEKALRVGPWQTAEDGLAAAETLDDKQRQDLVRQAVARVVEARKEAQAMLKDGRGAEAWLLANEMNQLMMKAYGVMQSPMAGEIRAVWDHSGQGLYPGDWPKTCLALKAAGISDILVNVAAPGFAHCRLDALPRSPVYETQGDQLAACLAAAKPLGLRVHAWMIAFSTTHASEHRMKVFAQQGWLLQNTAGESTPWLDPSVPEVRAMLAKAAEEILTRYAVDGLHLDFVRYPNYYESLGPGTRQRFEAARGKPVPDWPEGAKKRPVFNELVRWRGLQTTELVSDVRRLQRRIAPGILLTAAVLGKYPTCVESVGQDWESWIEQGYLDYVMPMNYTESRLAYDSLIVQQTHSPRQAGKVVGGIGVTASESRLDSADVIDQVNALRARGAAGFALFDLDATLETEILPVLALGLTAQKTQGEQR